MRRLTFKERGRSVSSIPAGRNAPPVLRFLQQPPPPDERRGQHESYPVDQHDIVGES
jgi:hypothetical protein